MKRTKNSRTISKSSLYDYSGVHEREESIAFLLDYAAKNKAKTEDYWRKMRRYYDGKHDISACAEEFALSRELNFTPAQCTDGYIHVESQINPSIPDFEFSPRDKSDYDKAKQRETVAKYICDNNDMTFKNSRNERNLGILGSAVWKVCWDNNALYGESKGDVSVLAPCPEEIFTDPSARDVDSCEYIGYVYRLHKQKALRIFADDFRRENTTLDDYLDASYFFNLGMSLSSDEYDCNDDTVSVTEWWFRQPCSGKADIRQNDRIVHYEWKAGDIALSVLINGKEVRYIPKYWKKTDFENFPFVIYSRLPGEKSIWGRSEIEMIIPLIDAKDRELTYAQLNNAFSSNDIIITEENALCDGENLDNSPGAVWKVRPGMMGKVARLGNMAASQNSLYSGAMYWQNLIETTTGNFEISQGKEPSSVTTATGIALLNERAESRKNQKNIDRNAGFKRLFELIDKTALEYYSDGKIVRIGAADDEIVYRYGGFVKKTRESMYIPSVDITIHTGSAISNSKAFTVSALTSLIGMSINSENYKLVKAYVETIGIPERAEICEYLDEKFGGGDDSQINYESIMKIIENSIIKEESVNE